MGKNFKDYFSQQAEAYEKYRPLYPSSLYQYLSDLAPSRQLAWDCATGNGQCAQGLSRYFQKVIASDASEQQIAQAKVVDNVEYRHMTAEHTSLEEHSVDLITVAQALHWFDVPAFFNEVKRTLKDRGIISIWTYSLFRTDDGINQVIDYLYHDVLGDYWPTERRWVENAYQGIDFPFEELAPKDFAMTANWSLEQVLGYLATWSSVRQYRNKNDHDPLNVIATELVAAWGDSSLKRPLRWPLAVRTGYYRFK